jgi:hypothetical protein
MQPYEWAVVRLVPRVERCEFINVGAIVYCQALDYLAAAVEVDEARARALDPGVDMAAVRAHLEAVEQLCQGAAGTGMSGERSQGDRFRWLTAPRSTMVQTSPIHTGLTEDPARELQRLMATMVSVGGG